MPPADLRFVHLYADDSESGLDVAEVARQVSAVLPRCRVDTRRPFLDFWQAGNVLAAKDRIARARISDTKQPFEKQQVAGKGDGAGLGSVEATQLLPLYDGHILQRMLASMISDDGETGVDHLHVVFTGMLACTFDEESWRYHARTVVCGTPSIVSTSGIVEAPARPREFYLAQAAGLYDYAGRKKKFAGRFIDHGDGKMITAAAASCALQAAFFFLSGGEPFCKSKRCRLYNSHWQQDLVRTMERPALCSRHRQMANNFNARPR